MIDVYEALEMYLLDDYELGYVSGGFDMSDVLKYCEDIDCDYSLGWSSECYDYCSMFQKLVFG